MGLVMPLLTGSPVKYNGTFGEQMSFIKGKKNILSIGFVKIVDLNNLWKDNGSGFLSDPWNDTETWED